MSRTTTDDPYRQMAMFLAGAIMGALHNPNITDVVRDFELLSGTDRTELFVRYFQSSATYRIRVESLGALEHDAAVVLGRRGEEKQ